MVTLQELQARHSPEKQARIRAFAEELLKTFEANHATYVNARKALEAAEKETRRCREGAPPPEGACTQARQSRGRQAQGRQGQSCGEGREGRGKNEGKGEGKGR